MYGREAADEFGENTQVKTHDSAVMGMSCLIQGRQTDREVSFIPSEFVTKLSEEDIRNRPMDIYNPTENFWYLELGGLENTIDNAEETKKRLIPLALGAWDHIKNSGKYDAKNRELEFLGFLPAKRESRRMKGEYIISQKDIAQNTVFDDTVAFGGWPIDGHYPAGYYHKGTPHGVYLDHLRELQSTLMNDDCFLPHFSRDISALCLQAPICGADVLTRVSKGCYSDYIRPLEADSSGIMIPHVMSLAEAQKIVYFTKFHPVGRRPIDGGNADGKYCVVNAADYIREANEQRFVVIQIEDPEPMDELEEICALPGIDMIFFGPANFAQGAGVPCDMGNEKVLEARRRVAGCARTHGKFAGTVGGMQNQDMLIDVGYQFINLGSDVRALYSYFSSITEKCSGKKAK